MSKKDEQKDLEQEVVTSMPDDQGGGQDDADKGPFDVWGRPFDPAIHLTDDQGQPLLTEKGKLRVQRGKGLKKSTLGSGVQTTMYTQTGAATAEILFVASMAIGGPEWEPNPNERAYMSHAWAEYFRSKGIKDLPPGVILATALISYAMPRFGQPETQGRLSKTWKWIKRRLRRKGKKTYEDPDIEIDHNPNGVD